MWARVSVLPYTALSAVCARASAGAGPGAAACARVLTRRRRCCGRFTLLLLYFALKRNAAAVGRAKCAPGKPKNFKGALELEHFAGSHQSLDHMLDLMQLTAEEAAAYGEMFGARKKRKRGKQKERKTKRSANAQVYGAAAKARVDHLREHTRAVFKENRAADEEGFYLVQHALGTLAATKARQFFPARTEDDVSAARKGELEEALVAVGFPSAAHDGNVSTPALSEAAELALLRRLALGEPLV